jgi:hypothetical protein
MAEVVLDANVLVALLYADDVHLQKAGKHEKDPFSAAMNGPGTALLRAKAVKKGASYEWQMSSDGGVTWVALGNSTVADMPVTGLVAGKTYMFRFRTTIAHTTSDWSQVISLFAH